MGDQARLAAQEEALAAAEAKRVSSSTLSRGGSSSSSSWSTSSSSYSRGSGGGQRAQGQMFFGRNSPISSGGPLFSSVNTTFGQTPIVYERRYEYSQSSHNRGRHSG